MALYAALLYYPDGQYWTEPTEEKFAPGYGEFFAAASAAGVLGGRGATPTEYGDDHYGRRRHGR